MSLAQTGFTIGAMSDASEEPIRKIIHIDMDAFFASVEQRDDPRLRGKPVAVGGSARRGVVAAASYEARRFGVRSAMPSVTAARRCPSLVFVPPRFDVYRAVSGQIRQIFARHSDLVEPLSLDEAYLDVTRDRRQIGSATRIAEMIRSAIRRETGLTASAGTIILLGTEKKRRLTLPNARIMIHQPAGGAQGRASDIEITAKEIVKLRARANELIAKECGKTIKEVEENTNRDFWLSPQEACDYGLCSKIITGSSLRTAVRKSPSAS